jgi:5-methyltetrahydrofolate--homocysteine methyltransferase
MVVSLKSLIDANDIIVADGGMGTMLLMQGLERGSCPELWNVERPEIVRGVHAAYLAAGAQIILTNTFGGTRARLDMHNLGDRVAELNRAGAQLARAEADSADHAAVVAGSMGPIGKMFEPLGDLTFENAVALFAEQATALAEGGVDVFWIETMSDLEEVRAAVEGCRRVAADMPLVTTMSFETRGRTMMGITPEVAAETLSDFGVVALGANCGRGPDELETAIGKMHSANPSAVLIAKANAGLPRMVGTETVYEGTPEVMAEYALRARDLGARIIGACCGSTPDHIRAIAGALHEKTI